MSACTVKCICKRVSNNRGAQSKLRLCSTKNPALGLNGMCVYAQQVNYTTHSFARTQMIHNQKQYYTLCVVVPREGCKCALISICRTRENCMAYAVRALRFSNSVGCVCEMRFQHKLNIFAWHCVRGYMSCHYTIYVHGIAVL